MNPYSKLPKARLFQIEWTRGKWYFGRNRLANAYRLQLWCVLIHFRMPWLEHSARQLHPHLFREPGL